MSNNTGKPYEKLTQAVFDQIVNADPSVVTTIEVQHDVTLKGTINSHQIDVYWEFEVAGVIYKTLIQTKELSRKVEQSHMETFRSVLADLPGSTGIFVTNHGYQSGAEKLAHACNIKTYILRNPKDGDWGGYMKTLHIEGHVQSPIAEKLELIIDGNWAKENNITTFERAHCRPSEMLITDQSGNEKTFEQIIHNICNEVGIGKTEYEQKFDEDTFLRFSDGMRLKLFGVKGVFGMRESISNLIIDGDNFISHVLKDLTNGKTTMLRKGTIPDYSVK